MYILSTLFQPTCRYYFVITCSISLMCLSQSHVSLLILWSISKFSRIICVVSCQSIKQFFAKCVVAFITLTSYDLLALADIISLDIMHSYWLCGLCGHAKAVIYRDVHARRYREGTGGFSPSPSGNVCHPVGEFWYFSSGMSLAIGHMAMFHINRESDAFVTHMLRNLCKESHCIALLWLSHWVTACIITVGLPVPVFS